MGYTQKSLCWQDCVLSWHINIFADKIIIHWPLWPGDRFKELSKVSTAKQWRPVTPKLTAPTQAKPLCKLTCCWWSPWLLRPAPHTRVHGRRRRHRCSYWPSHDSSWTPRSLRAAPEAERGWQPTEGSALSPPLASHAPCKYSPAQGRASGSPCLVELSSPGVLDRESKKMISVDLFKAENDVKWRDSTAYLMHNFVNYISRTLKKTLKN